MSKSSLLIQRYDGECLVDGFTLTVDSGDVSGLFGHIKKLPFVEKDLIDGCTVIDIIIGDDMPEDPVTVKAETRDWLLYTFLKLSKAGVKRAIRLQKEQTC